jgi:hypothetical protein
MYKWELFPSSKYRLNPSQQDFHKHNSTSTNLVTYVNTVVAFLSNKGKLILYILI